VESSQRVTLHYLDKYPLPACRDREVRKWVTKRALYYAYLCQDKCKADDEMAILKSIGHDVPWKYHLYAFGSQNEFTHALVSLAFKTLRVISNVKRGILNSPQKKPNTVE